MNIETIVFGIIRNFKKIHCVYTSENNSNIDLGTSLFIPKNKNFESEITTRFDFKYFNEIKKMPFKKNFALGFKKNSKSFHGRYPIDKKFTGKRDWINFSLQHPSGSYIKN